MNLKRGDAVVPDQSGRLLDNVLDVLRIVVLAAQDDHVLDAAADEQFAVVEETHVAGSQ